MLKKERLYRIEGLLRQRRFLTIAELEQELGVSRSSISRDLEELEQQGKIVRERGGASSRDAGELGLSIYSEPSVASREQVQRDEKERIAARAAEELKDGSCIFLDGGTTPAYLIPYVQDRRIQIVTPSTYLSSRLSSSFPGEIYLLGGSYLCEYESVCGHQALEMLDQFNFDCAFIGANGIDLKSGEVSVFSPQIGAMKTEAMRRSRRKILLADSAKFKARAMAVFAKVSQFDELITDALPQGAHRPENAVLCARQREESR